MKCVLFKNWFNGINGAVLDVCEYFLKLYELDNDFKLLIINNNKQYELILINLIEDRYNTVDIPNYKNNIIGINVIDLVKYTFDKILIVDYSTINVSRGLIRIKNNKSRIIILSDLHTYNPKYLIDKSLYPEHCVKYYGEMPFVYKDYKYNMKFLFNRYKKLRNIKDCIFIHAPKSNDYSFIPNINLPKNKQVIYKTEKHKNNLFELFDTFVYYHANKWFDPRPRLLVESYFYNKTIIYINNHNIADGSYYRYQDIIRNGIEHRTLIETDEVIRELL